MINLRHRVLSVVRRKGRTVEAHDTPVTHRYLMHYPPHPTREGDPNYVDFKHYHDKHRATARCYIGERIGCSECVDAQGHPCPPPEDGGQQPCLELHHAHVEFSLQNGISLKALEVDYPGISKKYTVGEWVESGANFRFLCAWHHRGAAGAHTASHSDWEASQYIGGLVERPEK